MISSGPSERERKGGGKRWGMKGLVPLAVLLLVTWMAWKGTDSYVRARWDMEDSSVVRIQEVVHRQREALLGSDGEWDAEKVLLRVLYRSGLKKGTTGTVEIVQLADSRLKLLPGTEYFLLEDIFDDGTTQYSISDRYRVPAVVGFVALACGVLVVLTGRAGLKALAGLFLSLAFLFWWFVPRVAEGGHPVASAVAAIAGVSIATVIFVVRDRRMWPMAFLGAVGGAVAASLTGGAMVALWQLTGLESDYAVLLASAAPHLSLEGILLASVMVGSIGAVLDVAVSVTATMSELFRYDPSIPLGRLWRAGLNVGGEVLGSMINTLILAYLGSSLPFAVLVALEGVDIVALLNDPHIAQEILRSVAGTVGLLLTVPITATVGVWWIRFLPRGEGWGS